MKASLVIPIINSSFFVKLWLHSMIKIILIHTYCSVLLISVDSALTAICTYTEDVTASAPMKTTLIERTTSRIYTAKEMIEGCVTLEVLSSAANWALKGFQQQFISWKRWHMLPWRLQKWQKNYTCGQELYQIGQESAQLNNTESNDRFQQNGTFRLS